MYETRPKRATVKDAEWQISVELVRDGQVLERSLSPLRISDASLNSSFVDTSRAIALWVDDKAQRRARQEAALKKASKRR